MIRRKTVFVVGAGASTEFGFPIGRDLRTEIAGLLTPTGVDEDIRHAFQIHDTSNYPSYVVAAHMLSQSVAGYRSIDRALAFGTADPDTANRMRLAGKLAIAKVILDRELDAKMSDRPSSAFSLADFDRTWLGELLILMQEHADARRPGRIFENVSFICFNYDRCVEQFFYKAVRAIHHCSPDQASNVVRQLRIFHPFGTVGCLPWQGAADKDVREFGWSPNGYDLLAAAKSLRTMGEFPSREELWPWQSEIALASTVVFLGFGFDPNNLDLIEPPGGTGARIFATMHKVSAPAQDQNIIHLKRVMAGPGTPSEPIVSSATCGQFILDYADELTF